MRSKSGRTGTYLSPGPWAQLVAVDAICPDGKVRKVRVGTPDTYFSAPGRCRIAGVNLHGFVSTAETFVWVSEHSPLNVQGEKSTMRDGKVLVDNPDAGEWLFQPYTNIPAYRRMLSALKARGVSVEGIPPYSGEG